MRAKPLFQDLPDGLAIPTGNGGRALSGRFGWLVLVKIPYELGEKFRETSGPASYSRFGVSLKIQEKNRMKIERAALLEMDEGEGQLVGCDPRQIGAEAMKAAGIEPSPLLAAVRAKCLDCVGDSPAEVRRCVLVSCALWPFRMNSNPWRKPMSEEARALAGERLRGRRAGSGGGG